MNKSVLLNPVVHSEKQRAFEHIDDNIIGYKRLEMFRHKKGRIAF